MGTCVVMLSAKDHPFQTTRRPMFGETKVGPSFNLSQTQKLEHSLSLAVSELGDSWRAPVLRTCPQKRGITRLTPYSLNISWLRINIHTVHAQPLWLCMIRNEAGYFSSSSFYFWLFTNCPKFTNMTYKRRWKSIKKKVRSIYFGKFKINPTLATKVNGARLR